MKFITKSIGELSMTIKTGKTPPTKNDAYFNGDIPWYTPGDLGGINFLAGSKRTITALALEDRKANLFVKNTVLLSCIGDIGKVGMVAKPSSSNQQITGIKLRKEIDPLFFVLWCKRHKKIFEGKARNAVVPILNNKILSSIKISYPENIDDQIRIAHLLNKVEGLIAQRKQNLQQLDDLLKSVFLDLFGDPVRNEKGWEHKPCNKVVINIQSGTSYGGEEKEHLENDEYGVLKISSVTPGWFNSTEFKAVKKSVINKPLKFVQQGDFLFSRANTIELVAACCIVEGEHPNLFIPDKLWLLSFAEVVIPQYFNFLLKNESFRNLVRKKASGGHDSMLNVSMKKFRSLSIPVPSLKLQTKFASIAEKVEGIKLHYQQSLIELENLYGTLSQQAFKGELDLSRIPLDREQPEIQEEKHKDATIPFDGGLPENLKGTIANLNAFNQSASSLKAIQEAARIAKLDLPQLDSVRQAAKQLAALRTPLQELKEMTGISQAMEQAEAAIKSLGLEHIESIGESVQLARSMAANLPKIDFGLLNQHGEAMRKATEPFESMRRVMESISIPDFTGRLKQAVDPEAFDFDDEEETAKRLFTREDVTTIFAYTVEPLGFDSLLYVLGELETVDFAGYETIKAILFKLLAEQQLVQFFDEEQKTLLLRAAP